MLRRSFLAGLLSQGVLLAVPAGADAAVSADAALRRLAARLRARMDALSDALTRHLPDAALHRPFSEGIGAALILEPIRQLPVSEQTHPAVQDLIRVACRRIGAALAHLSALLDTAAVGEAELVAGLGAVEQGGLAGLEPDTQRAVRQTIGQLRQQVHAGDLRRRWRFRLQALRRQARHRHRQGDLPALTDPVQRAEADSGLRRWGSAREDSAAIDVLAVLGIIAGGTLIYWGAQALIVGAVVSLWEPGLGLAVVLVGGLMMFGGIRLIRRSMARLRERGMLPPPRSPRPQRAAPTRPPPREEPGVLEELPPLVEAPPVLEAPPERAEEVEETDVVAVVEQPLAAPPPVEVPLGDALAVVTASGEIGWVRTAIAVRPGWSYTVQAIGTTATMDATAAHGPEGDAAHLGGAEHWLVGAPDGLLVGRVGADGPIFPIGASGTVPEGMQGALQLAINTAPGQRRAGALVVKIYGRAL